MTCKNGGACSKHGGQTLHDAVSMPGNTHKVTGGNSEQTNKKEQMRFGH